MPVGMLDDSKAIHLGHPSYVWRFGQDRRLDLIRRHAQVDGARVLDVGCGLGMYVAKLKASGADAYGVDVDPDKVTLAQERLDNIFVAPAETLPFPDDYFGTILLHEVLEHVTDDRQAVREAFRVTRTGGRVVIFVPNRLYPFETHGIFWRGKYRFGNVPLVNYLPDRWRNALCPHVRAYTSRGLRALFAGLTYRLIVHTQIFPGYDNIAYRRPALARVLRGMTYAAEHTPLRVLGLSHFLVVEKTDSAT